MTISSYIPIIIKFIIKIIEIDSSYNIIWKVAKKYFCHNCKFADGLNSLKLCPLISKSLFRVKKEEKFYIKKLFINLYVAIKSPCNTKNLSCSLDLLDRFVSSGTSLIARRCTFSRILKLIVGC